MPMKKILFVLIGLTFSIQSFAQNTYQDTTRYYSFKINYWFNLHHFLYQEAFLNTNLDSTMIDQKLSKSDRDVLDRSLNYYAERLLDEDLRTSDYMTEFKQWITQQNRNLSEVPAQFQPHIKILQATSHLYDAAFWPEHENACKEVLEENIEIIRKSEQTFVDQITKLTRQFWQSEKLRVDITYVAKSTKRNLRNRPYTSIFPTHVVMNTIGENEVPGNWFELLFHESAHHLILSRSYFIGGTIKDVVETMQVKEPRQLGHAYLFYFTGKLAQQFLEEAGINYPQMYMERNRVFSSYYPLLEIHIQDYMDRKISLAEATERMINDINK